MRTLIAVALVACSQPAAREPASLSDDPAPAAASPQAAMPQPAFPSQAASPSPQAAAPPQQAFPSQSAAPPRQQQATPPPPQAATIRDYAATCRAIADDIERIRTQFPQLVDFRAADASCRMFYEFHTHRPTTRGGWSSGVPHPDDDGLWFYIGIYDPNGPEAMSQINMQPAVPNWWIGDRKVMFLALEGKATKPVSRELFAILERHGLVTKPR